MKASHIDSLVDFVNQVVPQVKSCYTYHKSQVPHVPQVSSCHTYHKSQVTPCTTGLNLSHVPQVSSCHKHLPSSLRDVAGGGLEA
ncbi:hypothetical protein CEXT_542891 [Caerostris extrusa]|uniref:Uncharacterized protein n=1 Tax=Caerostris extrusa TaxID=172846 RepID=A0AAV4U496_CAEEX|nr:hypothetical protein CEXT_542891 [Caerostris extrusa]